MPLSGSCFAHREEEAVARLHLVAYRDALATHGLTIAGFNGHTLRLQYDPAADAQPGADFASLASFAIVELDRIDQQLPPEPELFPGVQQAVVG